ncbi:hypothetical protein [Caldisericum sp.]|uniref:hypothetical protein n=1 Tax=Caldisericum sp. TaxID=2499687 RepID=UPI003D0FC82A
MLKSATLSQSGVQTNTNTQPIGNQTNLLSGQPTTQPTNNTTNATNAGTQPLYVLSPQNQPNYGLLGPNISLQNILTPFTPPQNPNILPYNGPYALSGMQPTTNQSSNQSQTTGGQTNTSSQQNVTSSQQPVTSSQQPVTSSQTPIQGPLLPIYSRQQAYGYVQPEDEAGGYEAAMGTGAWKHSLIGGALGTAGNMVQMGLMKMFKPEYQKYQLEQGTIQQQLMDKFLPYATYNKLGQFGAQAAIEAQRRSAEGDYTPQALANLAQANATAAALENASSLLGSQAIQSAGRQTQNILRQLQAQAGPIGTPAALSAIARSAAQGAAAAQDQALQNALAAASQNLASAGQLRTGASQAAEQAAQRLYETYKRPAETETDLRTLSTWTATPMQYGMQVGEQLAILPSNPLQALGQYITDTGKQDEILAKVKESQKVGVKGNQYKDTMDTILQEYKDHPDKLVGILKEVYPNVPWDQYFPLPQPNQSGAQAGGQPIAANQNQSGQPTTQPTNNTTNATNAGTQPLYVLSPQNQPNYGLLGPNISWQNILTPFTPPQNPNILPYNGPYALPQTNVNPNINTNINAGQNAINAQAGVGKNNVGASLNPNLQGISAGAGLGGQGVGANANIYNMPTQPVNQPNSLNIPISIWDQIQYLMNLQKQMNNQQGNQ